MKTRNVRRVLLVVLIVIVALCAAHDILIHNGHMEINKGYSRIHDKLLDFLVIELVMEKHIPEKISDNDLKKTTLIYVLGGSQNSLIHRFRLASILYHQGLSDKILILSRPGLTEFNLELGRNMMNNEWSIRELEGLNIRKEDIEPVFVVKRLLGTLSEGKSLSDIVRKYKCDRLILVTSDYHTRRVYNTFFWYSSSNSFEIYLYGSKDTKNLRVLLYEYVKLLFYDHIILRK